MFLLFILFEYSFAECVPFGMRLTLGTYYNVGGDDQIRLAFNTKEQCQDIKVYLDEAIVQHTVDFLDMTKIYQGTQFNIDYGTYIHHAYFTKMINLKHTYKISSTDYEQSFEFELPNSDSLSILVFGDMDSNWNKNSSKPTFDYLQKQVKNNVHYDTLLFMGDMAYDFETNNCLMGEQWLARIASFTSRYPFMAAAGNHDSGLNQQFDFFKRNFDNPLVVQQNADFWVNFYNFQLGPVQFIQYDPYLIVYKKATPEFITLQLQLMRNALWNVNRTNTPWIIVYTHYPLYCSGAQDRQCRENFQSLSQFEDLFKEFKVDLYLAGHQHSYERDRPTYKNQTVESSVDKSEHIYKSHDVPIQIIEGVGGNDYFMPDAIYEVQQYTVAQSVGTGMGIMKINRTHLYFEHIETPSEKVVDYVTLSKVEQKDSNTKMIVIIVVCVCLALLIIGVSSWCYYKKRHTDKRYKIGEEQV